MKIFFKNIFLSLVIISLPILSFNLMKGLGFLFPYLVIKILASILIGLITFGLIVYLITILTEKEEGWYLTFLCIGCLFILTLMFYIIK